MKKKTFFSPTSIQLQVEYKVIHPPETSWYVSFKKHHDTRETRYVFNIHRTPLQLIRSRVRLHMKQARTQEQRL